MIKILSFTAQNSGAEIALRIGISDGEHREVRRFVLSIEQFADLGLVRGEISRETFGKIEDGATLYRAVRKGNELLGYGANSKRRLEMKLRSKGFDAEVAQNASRTLSEKGMIDEDADALREAEKCLAKLWGKKRIASQLYAKGYEKETIDNALASLGNVDFVGNCRKLIEKKYRCDLSDNTQLQRTVTALCRYGYTYSEIKEALQSK